MRVIQSIVGFWVVSLSVSAYGQSLSGTWDVVEQVDATACGEGNYQETYTATAVQDGNQLTVTSSGITRSGTLNGNILSFTATYDEDGGTVTSSGTLSFSGGTVSGSSIWTFTLGSFNCSGSSTISGTQLTGPGGGPGGGTAVLPPVASQIAYSITDTWITISWEEVAGADGYRIYYAPYPSADPIESIDLGNLLAISGELPVGTALYIAVETYNSAGAGGISNVEHFTIKEVATSLPANVAPITLNFGVSDMVDRLPPREIWITDSRWEEIDEWEMYVNGELADYQWDVGCRQREGDKCRALSFGYNSGSAWPALNAGAEWGDQFRVSMKGLNNQGEVISQTAVDYVWNYVPNKMQFTIAGEPTVHLDNVNPHGFTTRFGVYGGNNSSLGKPQNYLSLSVQRPFQPGVPADFYCAHGVDYFQYPMLTVITEGDGREYEAHQLYAGDSNCSGQISTSPLPLTYTNGYVWHIEFNATIKRDVDGVVEIKSISGSADIQELN